MRLAFALALIIATGGIAQVRAADSGEITIEALPEVEVRLPADRTEFSVPALPAPDDAQRQIEVTRPQAIPSPAAIMPRRVPTAAIAITPRLRHSRNTRKPRRPPRRNVRMSCSI